MRFNSLSRLPCGPPYDNYFLPGVEDKDFSIAVDDSWVQLARQHHIHDFDSEEYLNPATIEELDRLILQSPLGSDVHVGNARDQYLFLRESLRGTLEDVNI
jgi:hypothetical protein